jgi:hypothetical protein
MRRQCLSKELLIMYAAEEAGRQVMIADTATQIVDQT